MKNFHTNFHRLLIIFLSLLIFTGCQYTNLSHPNPKLVNTEIVESNPSSTSIKTPTQRPTQAPTPSPPVLVNKDILYVEPLQDNVSKQWLDIYSPNKQGPYPVIVFLHGLGQTKDSFIEESQWIAEQGFVVYTINWPNWNGTIAAQENGRGFRETYEVLSCAVRYAKATAVNFGGDPSKIILVGYSAGARFGSWFALSGDTIIPKWEEISATRGGPNPQVSCLTDGYSPNVDAFIGIGGHYAFIENLKDKDVDLYNVVSPIAQIGERPELSVRLLHGDKDGRFPISFSVRFHDLLEASGYDTELIIFDGGHVVSLEPTIMAIFDLTEGE